jgi:hypothetical protein
MPHVRIAEKKVWVDQTPILLLSGEVHYWRLDPPQWRPVLQRVREMGIKTVATYASWDYHEIAPSQYDFRGETEPRRNLLGFLDLLTEEGFWIIFRPGPYIYSEWSNNGVPDEPAKFHRGSAEFRALAEPYMQAVTDAVRPYLATSGGGIILWQADNEIDAWPHLYTEVLGLGMQSGPFQQFLTEHYQEDLDALNKAWRTNYPSFEQARAVSEMFRDEPVLMSRYNDYRSFIHWYVNDVARWAAGRYREYGVDVPIIFNTYSGVSTQRWADLEAIGDLVGSDIYPSNEHLYRAGEQRHIIEALRYAHSFSKVPYVAEFEAGIWHDWLGDVGTLTPNHYRLICLSALLGGAAGWNWYMLVNRDNWYQSPINEWGWTRPHLFDAFMQITTLFERLDPTTLEKVTETAVTFDPLQRSTQRPGHELLQSFYQADIDYEFFDLDGALTDKRIAFYAGGSWLSEKGQRRLMEFIENGGHLIFIGASPSQDAHMLPLNLLSIPAPDGIMTGQGNVNLKLFEGSAESPWLHLYENVPGEPLIVERLKVRAQPSEELALQFSLQIGLKYTVGYTETRGQGRLTVVGLQPSPALLLALHDYFGVPIACRSNVGDVVTALYQRDGHYYVIATNDGNEGKGAEITFGDSLLTDGQWTVENLDSGKAKTVYLRNGTGLTITLPRKDGAIFKLTPTTSTTSPQE